MASNNIMITRVDELEIQTVVRQISKTYRSWEITEIEMRKLKMRTNRKGVDLPNWELTCISNDWWMTLGWF